MLLDVTENSATTTILLRGQQKNMTELSFTDLARDLNYPQYWGDQRDPLQILAALPLPIYVTTSFHEFTEEALVRAGKAPVPQVCFWSGKILETADGHEIRKDYRPWEWDFRILFRCVLTASGRTNRVNLIIQVAPEQQHQIDGNDELQCYLEKYFEPAHFKVEWNSPELFLNKMWDEWKAWRAGQ